MSGNISTSSTSNLLSILNILSTSSILSILNILSTDSRSSIEQDQAQTQTQQPDTLQLPHLSI